MTIDMKQISEAIDKLENLLERQEENLSRIERALGTRNSEELLKLTREGKVICKDLINLTSDAE